MRIAEPIQVGDLVECLDVGAHKGLVPLDGVVTDITGGCAMFDGVYHPLSYCKLLKTKEQLEQDKLSGWNTPSRYNVLH